MFCDFCEKLMSGRNPCFGCAKDICYKCAKIIFSDDPFDGEPAGDYPPYACAACEAKLKPFADQAWALRAATEERLSAIRAEFKSACREQEFDQQ